MRQGMRFDSGMTTSDRKGGAGNHAPPTSNTPWAPSQNNVDLFHTPSKADFVYDRGKLPRVNGYAVESGDDEEVEVDIGLSYPRLNTPFYAALREKYPKAFKRKTSNTSDTASLFSGRSTPMLDDEIGGTHKGVLSDKNNWIPPRRLFKQNDDESDKLDMSAEVAHHFSSITTAPSRYRPPSAPVKFMTSGDIDMTIIGSPRKPKVVKDKIVPVKLEKHKEETSELNCDEISVSVSESAAKIMAIKERLKQNQKSLNDILSPSKFPFRQRRKSGVTGSGFKGHIPPEIQGVNGKTETGLKPYGKGDLKGMTDDKICEQDAMFKKHDSSLTKELLQPSSVKATAPEATDSCTLPGYKMSDNSPASPGEVLIEQYSSHDQNSKTLSTEPSLGFSDLKLDLKCLDTQDIQSQKIQATSIGDKRCPKLRNKRRGPLKADHSLTPLCSPRSDDQSSLVNGYGGARPKTYVSRDAMSDSGRNRTHRRGPKGVHFDEEVRVSYPLSRNKSSSHPVLIEYDDGDTFSSGLRIKGRKSSELPHTSKSSSVVNTPDSDSTQNYLSANSEVEAAFQTPRTLIKRADLARLNGEMEIHHAHPAMILPPENFRDEGNLSSDYLSCTERTPDSSEFSDVKKNTETGVSNHRSTTSVLKSSNSVELNNKDLVNGASESEIQQTVSHKPPLPKNKQGTENGNPVKGKAKSVKASQKTKAGKKQSKTQEDSDHSSISEQISCCPGSKLDEGVVTEASPKHGVVKTKIYDRIGGDTDSGIVSQEGSQGVAERSSQKSNKGDPNHGSPIYAQVIKPGRRLAGQRSQSTADVRSSEGEDPYSEITVLSTPPVPKRPSQSNLAKSKELSASRTSLSEKIGNLKKSAKSKFSRIRRAISLENLSPENHASYQPSSVENKPGKMKKTPSLKSLTEKLGFRKKSKTLEPKPVPDQNGPSAKKPPQAPVRKSRYTSAPVTPAHKGQSSQSAPAMGKLIKKNRDGSQVVEIVKPPHGPFGFYIAKGSSQVGNGIFISRLSDQQQARCFAGVLNVGDEVLEVNEQPVKDKSLDGVYQCMTQSNTLLLKILPYMTRKDMVKL